MWTRRNLSDPLSIHMSHRDVGQPAGAASITIPKEGIMGKFPVVMTLVFCLTGIGFAGGDSRSLGGTCPAGSGVRNWRCVACFDEDGAPLSIACTRCDGTSFSIDLATRPTVASKSLEEAGEEPSADVLTLQEALELARNGEGRVKVLDCSTGRFVPPQDPGVLPEGVYAILCYRNGKSTSLAFCVRR